ncbi:phage portal protein [Mesorhizobium sp.]|uniref:phage portal protein n=1 Tax=Mesorhizobium sp. TaxID=1871066 RepID=UPI001217DC53|nr:phage portal protein [Mesorhizobium sp.]TIS46183.1 MAG: phage portal protein [Mesorhizobium sp.]
MGLLDRLWRRTTAPLAVRRYDGATGAKNRFDAARATFGTYATEVSAARGTVQGRARHVVASNALARAAKEAWTTAVVGPGLIPTSQHPDPTTRAALDAYFATRAKRVDVTGRSNFGTLTANAVGDEFVDGEAFARWVGDQLQAVPAEQVANDLTTMLSDGRQIVNGVEIDADGRVLAYHIHPARPTDVFATYAPPVRVDAADILHLGQFETGAYRAISKFAPVLLRLDALDSLEDAQAMNVKIAALLSIILTNENDVSGDDPLAEGVGLAPGAILKVPGGWKVNATAPQQAQQSAELVQHMIRTIAAGLGIPVHLVDGNLTQANYSSLRAALVSFRQKIDAYQFNVLQPLWLDPVWRRVATAAVLSGAVKADLNDDLFAVEWIPPAQPWVDPEKDLKAQILAIDNGLMSRKQAVAAQGYSIEKLDAEIAAHPPVAKPQAPKEAQP